MNNPPTQLNSSLVWQLFKSEDVKRLFVVSTLLFWCACMVAVRIDRTGSGYYRFLLSNLFLACVPLFFSTVLRVGCWRRWHWTIIGGIGALWLLFLPNAPYILTDILHLTRTTDAPPWYDLALLLSCAGTGLLLGYLSLIDIQRLAAQRFNSVVGWLVALISIELSGFAIYLGRFLRWNSWDVLLSPTRLFDIAAIFMHPFANLGPLAVTLIFGAILALGYISLRVLLLGQSSGSV